ncbi:hypothetical protein K8R33_04760 [archaeon]|nr:hypothetical protein [archaeon]
MKAGYCRKCKRYVYAKKSTFNFRIFFFIIVLLAIMVYLGNPAEIMLFALIPLVYNLFFKPKNICSRCGSKVRIVKQKKKKKNGK